MWFLLGVVEFLGQFFFDSRGVGVINRGISFGIDLGGWLWWIGVGMMILLTKSERSWGRDLIWAGGMANGLSRILLGGVRDYLMIPYLGLWFNFSDVMICFGLAHILWKSRS